MEDSGSDKYFMARQQMVKYDLAGRGIRDKAVLEAMGRVKREEFLPEKYLSQAYSDGPLPIGLGQTISQPYIVALMTEQLRVDKDCEVLEIGTGSGYQTAILSSLCKKVYTVERLAELSESAQAVLGRLCYENIEFHIGDGSGGWYEQRKFDRIMVTASLPRVPDVLLEQVKTGGIIVAPVGVMGVQKLIVCEKKAAGAVEHSVCDVRFVKIIGEYGFEE
jgi:protein-L-isoaspartate(D-aspartate) O-methyltransferase